MKVFFFLLLKFIFITITYSNDEYIISSFATHTTNKIETSKGYKFSTSEAIGNWQDNKGNYGKSKIIFYVEEFDTTTSIKGLGEFIDQENRKIWLIPERETEQDAGVGTINIIDASNKYTFLIDKKCFYAINYLDDRSFLKVKCN